MDACCPYARYILICLGCCCCVSRSYWWISNRAGLFAASHVSLRTRVSILEHVKTTREKLPCILFDGCFTPVFQTQREHPPFIRLIACCNYMWSDAAKEALFVVPTCPLPCAQRQIILMCIKCLNAGFCYCDLIKMPFFDFRQVNNSQSTEKTQNWCKQSTMYF